LKKGKRSMTRDEHQMIMNIADMIQGEINRMCVTDELAELDTMAFHAEENIKRLRDMRYRELTGQVEK